MRLFARVGLRWRSFDSSWAPKRPRPGGEERRRLDSWAVGRVGRTILRWRVPSVDLQPQERPRGLEIHCRRARRGNDAPFSWTVPREGRSVAHPNPKGTQDSSFARSRVDASALVTGSRSKRRSLGLHLTNADSCVHPERNPQPESPDQRGLQPPGRGPFGDHPQQRPKQRTSRSRRRVSARSRQARGGWRCATAPTPWRRRRRPGAASRARPWRCRGGRRGRLPRAGTGRGRAGCRGRRRAR